MCCFSFIHTLKLLLVTPMKFAVFVAHSNNFCFPRYSSGLTKNFEQLIHGICKSVNHLHNYWNGTRDKKYNVQSKKYEIWCVFCCCCCWWNELPLVQWIFMRRRKRKRNKTISKTDQMMQTKQIRRKKRIFFNDFFYTQYASDVFIAGYLCRLAIFYKARVTQMCQYFILLSLVKNNVEYNIRQLAKSDVHKTKSRFP